MGLRNKISHILGVHPFSFLVCKMNREGNIDYILNSTNLIKSNTRGYHQNQLPFFLFQIDPKIYYDTYNKYYDESFLQNKERDFSLTYENLKKDIEQIRKSIMNEFEEDERGATNDTPSYYSKFIFSLEGEIKKGAIKVNTDGNNGLPSDYIMTFLYLKKYASATDFVDFRKRILFPRIVYLNKNWTTKQIHHAVFEYFSPVLRKFHKFKHTTDLWNEFFFDLDTNNDTNNQTFHQQKSYPYRIRMRNILPNIDEPCVFCSRPKCDDCLLPYDDTTLNDLLQKIPKNEEMGIDNSYFYLNYNQRNTIHNSEKDFSLEVTWLDQYEEIVKELNNKEEFEIKSSKYGSKHDKISIYNCFKNFVKLEKLQENNEWFCPQCKTHQKANKKMEIYKAPHILIVHLKRFRNNTKLDSVVDFPINGLDISNYVINKDDGFPCVYDLFAISNHYGGLGGGHYHAFAQNYLDKNWYDFNDSSVRQIDSHDNLVSSAAYVLFYRRREINSVNLSDIYNKSFINLEYTTATATASDENIENGSKIKTLKIDQEVINHNENHDQNEMKVTEEYK